VKTIATYSRLDRAHSLAATLGAFGIDAEVWDQGAAQWLEGGAILTGVRVVVPDENEEEARRVVAEFDPTEPPDTVAASAPVEARRMAEIFRWLLVYHAVMTVLLWLVLPALAPRAPEDVERFLASFAPSAHLWSSAYWYYAIFVAYWLAADMLVFFFAAGARKFFLAGLLLDAGLMFVFPAAITYGWLALFSSIHYMVAGALVMLMFSPGLRERFARK